MRLIDADVLFDAVKDFPYGYRGMIKSVIAEQLTIEPERKKGKWIQLEKGIHTTSYKCSVCGRTVRDDTGYDVAIDYPYCNCGADMRGDQ